MATSNDHPGMLFIQARGFTAGRPDGPPIWIVFHDMEASETLTRAESTAAYFAAPPDDRRVSSHYCVDADSKVQCVDLDDSAWTVGNRQGNNRGINWELAGFARQTRAEWLDDYGLAMFRQMAPIVRSDAERFGIPLRWLTDDQVRAMQPGLTTHVQLGRVFGGTTHTDPGPAFPYDVVLQIMKEGDMTRAELLKLIDEAANRSTPDGRNFANDLWRIQRMADGFDPGTPETPGGASLEPRIAGLEASLARIEELLAGGGGAGGAVDLAAVRLIVRQELDSTRLGPAS